MELGLPITPVEGTLCFFGRVPGTYAANFDVNGSFWCGAWGLWDDGGACGMARVFSKRFLKDAWNFFRVDSCSDKKKVQVTKKQVEVVRKQRNTP